MGSAGGLCSSPRAWGCGWNVIRLLCFAFINWGAAENTAAVIVVNQTTPSICAMEGSEFTIECTFNTSNNSTKWFAEWYKTKNNVTAKVNNGTDRIILSADKEKRSLSLTVKKADVTDSGTYVCWVGSKDGTYPGTGTQVTIDGQPKAPVKCKKLCTEFSRKEIPQKLLKTYRKTEPSCPKAAIICCQSDNMRISCYSIHLEMELSDTCYPGIPPKHRADHPACQILYLQINLELNGRRREDAG
ncbi:uncharacterized protein LOC120384660 [Mauremys reevesii]|uniref:uncharacterized protein LOC120384660 n=1 Tax=Mauremys reevesii TaxID=260615 RepID=UPI001940129E|nr:uncharacterized protein LOC120384660 [Mauremys reevesii]